MFYHSENSSRKYADCSLAGQLPSPGVAPSTYPQASSSPGHTRTTPNFPGIEGDRSGQSTATVPLGPTTASFVEATAGCQSQASPPLPRLSSVALGAKYRAIMWLVMPSSPQLGPPILSGLLLAPLYPQFVSLCLLRAYGGGPLRTLLIFSNLGVCMSQPVPQVRADNPFSISQLKESD